MTITEQKRKRNPHQPVGRWIRVDKRLAIYLRDRFTCLYCGTDLHAVTDPRHIQLDHGKPVSKGGSNSERNVFVACMHCNCKRADQSLRSFASPGAVERIREQTKLDLAPFRRLARAIIGGEITKEQALLEVR